MSIIYPLIRFCGTTITLDRKAVYEGIESSAVDMHIGNAFGYSASGVDINSRGRTADEVFEFASLVTMFATPDLQGGVATDPLVSQRVDKLVSIEGVEVLASLANEVGVGYLTITKGVNSFVIAWHCSGGYTPVPRLVTSSGLVELSTVKGVTGGALLIEIDFTELVEGTYTLVVSNLLESIVPNVTSQVAVSGSDSYYGLVVKNTNPLLTYSKIKATVSVQPVSGVEVLIGVNPANVGNLTEVLADNTTPPAGVAFGTQITIPSLAPNQEIPLWVYVIVPEAGTTSLKVDIGRIYVEALL